MHASFFRDVRFASLPWSVWHTSSRSLLGQRKTGLITVRDENSTNGVRVNGNRIGEVVLKYALPRRPRSSHC